MRHAFRLLALSLLLFAAAEAQLRQQLELFFDLAPRDSVTRLEQPAPDQIRIEVLDRGTGAARALSARVPAAAADRLRRQAEAEGVEVSLWIGGPDAGTEPPAAAAAVDEDGPYSNPKELRRNRLNYVIGQMFFSSYVYSFAIPAAFEVDPNKVVAIQLLSLPVAFGTHYYLTRDKEFHDAHVWSTSYFATNSLFLSYTLPLVLGADENFFKIGSFAALGAYPAGLWLGYRHGETFKDNPGRVRLQSSLAATGVGMGFMLPFVWMPFDGGDWLGRLAVAQTVAGGVAGHYLSYLYRPEEAVPGGIGPGIGTHAVLGFLAGATVAAWMEPGIRGTFGLMLAGTGAGLAEGLHFFRHRYDSYEKATYDWYGTLGGALAPLGLAILLESRMEPETMMTLVTAGAVAGYAITHRFTKHLVEKPRPARFQGHPGFNFSLDLVPVPEPYVRANARGETEVAMRLRVPGMSYRF